MMYRLVILSGPEKGKGLVIDGPAVTVGRDLDCLLRFPYDDEVSRKHAVIEKRADGVYLRDLNPTNPSRVNDNPIQQEVRLSHGDIIEFGRTRLQFQIVPEHPTEIRPRFSYTEALATSTVVLVLLAEIGVLIFLASQRDLLVPPPEKPAAVTEAVRSPVANAALLQTAQAPEEPATQPVQEAEHRQGEAESVGETSSAVVAEAEAPIPVTNLTALRMEIEELRRQLEELVRATSVVSQAETVPPAETTFVEEVETIENRAQALLRQAALEIQRMNYVQADELLQRAQILAPDFVPAYIERARLYEQRGMLQEAAKQWKEVLDRSFGTPLYEQAAAERIRLARMIVQQQTAAPTATAKPNLERLPRRIRIVDVAQERFPRNEQFDEMRLVRVTLKPKPGERDIDPFYLEVRVTFFDENTDTRTVRPTRATVSRALIVDGPWAPNQQKTVTATYIVPRGFREQELSLYGERMLYYGYAIQVFYRGQLQDVEARPRSLLKELEKLPSPFHGAADASG